MNNFRRGNHHLRGEIGMVQIFHNPLSDHRGNPVPGCHSRQNAVFPVSVGVEGRNIDSGNLCHFQQEFLLAPTGLLGLPIAIQDFHRNLLTFSQREEIHKLRQGFGIEGADASGEYHIVQALPVPGVEGYSGKAQHIENIGIGHFIANGKGHHVKVLYGILALQCPQGQVLCSHGFFHIPPGGEYPLAPNIGNLVHHTIENPHTHIGHTNLIGVRETECHPQGHILFLLSHLAPFAAGVTGRLLNPRQNAILLICHSFTSL